MTDVWPVYSGELLTKEIDHRRKKDRQELPWTYVSAEPGCLGAATLTFDAHNTARWTFAFEGNEAERRLSAGALRVLYTPASPRTVPPKRFTTVNEYNHGLRFLQTRYPDVDLADANFQRIVMKDRERTERLAVFDPLAGPLLDSIVLDAGRQESQRNVVFADGETGQSLSLMRLSSNISKPGKHDPQVLKTFSTPILQISTLGSAHSRTYEDDSSGPVAVRTMGSLSVHEVKATPSGKVLASDLLELSRSETNDAYAVDMKFLDFHRLAIVNEHGMLYDCHMRENKTPQVVTLAHTASSRNRFWRISPVHDEPGCLVTSDQTVTRVDMRAPHEHSALYTPSGQQIVTIGEHTEPYVFCAVTTTELVWLDRRFAQRPVFGWKHGLAVDRSMMVQTLPMASGSATFVSSQAHNLAFMYHTDTQKPMRIMGQPYPLRISPHTAPSLGCLILPTANNSSDTFAAVCLDQDGAVSATNLSMKTIDETAEDRARPTRVQESLDAMDVQQGVSALEAKENTKVHMRSVYEDIFAELPSNVRETTETVLQSLYSMGDFWDTADEPVEHMLTALDIAVRSCEDPIGTSRAAFLANTIITSHQAYHAVAQSKVPRSTMATKAKHHSDLTPFLRQVCSELTGDAPIVMDTLRDLETAEDEARVSDDIIRTRLRSRQQVVVDSSLASDVYSSRAFLWGHSSRSLDDRQVDDDLETMSLAADAMSLADSGSSSFHFGYLQPLLKTTGRRSGARSDGTPDQAGVDLLLSEWSKDSQPHEYHYTDPYNLDKVADRIPKTNALTPKGTSQPITSAPPAERARRPPIIAVPKEPPHIMSPTQVPPLFSSTQPSAALHLASSQPLGGDRLANSMNSQDLMPSTQVLAGPHGGRPSFAKKKKRVGGF